jgi:DNA-binding protein HU-beta
LKGSPKNLSKNQPTKGALNMKQDELIGLIANDTGVTKSDVEKVLKSLGNTAQGVLSEGGELTVPGICKLSVNAKPARQGRNPRTGEAVEIAAKNAPKLTALKALKDAANA